MRDKFSTRSQFELSRRDLIKNVAAAGGAAAILPAIGMGPAYAADPVVRGYGVTTAQLKDWSIMTKSIGVQMEITRTNKSAGRLLRHGGVCQLGDRAAN